MIEIRATVYKVFYEVLCVAIIEREYKNETEKPHHSKIWLNYTGSKTKKKYPFAAHRATNPKYFLLKYGQLNPEYTRKGRVSHAALYKALRYIGIENPDSNEELDYRNVKALLEEFEKKYSGLIYREELKYFDAATSEHSKPEKPVLDLVEEFFKNIENKYFDRAWNLLSNRHKESWVSFEKFSFYFEPLKIHQLQTLIYYEKDKKEAILAALILYDFPSFVVSEKTPIDWTFGELGKLQDLITAFRKQKKTEEELAEFDKTPLSRLFTYDRMEYALSDQHRFPEVILQLNGDITLRHRVFHFGCILDRGKWLIHGIRSVDALRLF